MFKVVRYMLFVTVLAVFGTENLVQAQDDVVRRIPVTGLQFGAELSPDGKTLAVYELGTVHMDMIELPYLPIRLIDLASGEEKVLVGQTDYAADVAFSPDGKTLVSSHGGGYLSLWDVATGAEIKRIPALSRLQYVAFLPDGQSVAVQVLSGQQPLILVFDTTNGMITDVLTTRYPTVQALSESVSNSYPGLISFDVLPDGSGVIAVTQKDNVWQWPFDSDQPTVLRQTEYTQPMFYTRGLRVTTDGSTVVYYDLGDDQVHWLDIATGDEISTLAIDTIATPYISLDGQKVLWLTPENTLKVWDAAQPDSPTELTLPTLLSDHFGMLPPLRLTADGSQVILSGFLASSGENEIWVLDLP